MIVEIFGPPGAGKTTLAQALAVRLRQRGIAMALAASFRPAEHRAVPGRATPGGRGAADTARRLARSALAMLTTAGKLSDGAQGAGIARTLLRLIPPRSAWWSLRLLQYIWRLSCTWREARAEQGIVIFDQAFVHVVCSLTLLGTRADDEVVAAALEVVPKPDLLVRLDAPREILEGRLVERQRQQGRIEQLLELDLETNLRSAAILDRLHAMLRERGCPAICVDSGGQVSLDRAVDRLEQEVLDRLGKTPTGGVTPEVSADFTPPVAASTRDPLVGQVRRGSIAAFAIYAASAGLAYCAQLMIARTVGPADYGIYAYVFAWMTVLAYFAALGFDVSILRFVPAYRAQGAWALVCGVIRFAERTSAAVGIGVALAGAAVVAFWGAGMPSHQADTFLAGLALIPVLALLWIRCSIARAFGGVVSALAPERVVRDGLLICLLGLAVVPLGWRLNAVWVMSATLISSAAALGFVTLAAGRLRPQAISHVAPVSAVGSWLRAAGPLMIIGTVDPLMNRIGVVLLGWSGNTQDAGIYALAFNVAFLVVLSRTAINALFAPTVSELFTRNDRAGLQSLITMTSGWMLLGAVCIALPLSLLASSAIAWFGPSFVAGVPAMRILLLGQVFAAGAGSQLYLMTMTGNERSAAWLTSLSAAANLLVGVALIRSLGLTGAAIAAAATQVIWNLGMGLFIWRRLDLVPGVLALLRPPTSGPRKDIGQRADVLG